MNKIIKNALVLTAITLVSGLLLGLVYEITKEPIQVQSAKAQEKAYQAVFPDAGELEPLCESQEELRKKADEVLSAAGFEAERIKDAYRVVGTDGSVLGLAMNVTTTEGYGGDINFSLGIRKDGTVNGISILTISETAGLGMKAAEESFYGQYADKRVDSFSYTKEGARTENEIDAISGATITTNAVTNGVNAGIRFFQSVQEGGMLDE